MIRFASTLGIVLCLSVGSRADNLVSLARNGSLSARQIDERAAALFGPKSLVPATTALDFYKVRYRSSDEKSRPVVLSGLVVLPRGRAPKGLVIYNHGTTFDRRLSPSRYVGQTNFGETVPALLAFASGGYAVAMPDYLGLGDHKAAHPYPLGSLNSRSAIDIIAPARSLAARQKVSIGSRLFITGYSEGGAVAMWAVRQLESKPDALFRVTAAAPASGPYDLSGVTRESLLSRAPNSQLFALRLYLLAGIVHSFHKRSGIKLTQYFKPSMALTVSRAFNGTFSDADIAKRLVITATLMRANNSIERVVTPRFMKAFRSANSSDPIMREIAKNNVYNWTPRTKMLLIALKKDDVVTQLNTSKTIATMRRRGIKESVVKAHIITDSRLNHITGIGPAVLVARRYFDSLK